MVTYLLFVFVKHKNQDKFVEVLSDELSGGLDTTNIKYFYGPEAIVLTFTTKSNFDDISKYVEFIFEESNLVYFLLPYQSEKISFNLKKDVEEHLFGHDKMSEMKEIFITEKKEVQNLTEEELTDSFEELLQDLKMIEDEEDEILQLKKKIVFPSLDDILDKIKIKGLDSLTQKEKKILENYSN